MTKEKSQSTNPLASLLIQGWAGIAVWMTFGLLLEGLLGYKTPAYLNDAQRRELFTLAHTHGSLLSVVLIIAALGAKSFALELSRITQIAFRIGAILMPLGFFVAGIWHPEGDPGIAIWLVPPGALLMIFAAISMTLAGVKRNKVTDKEEVKNKL
ncbi:MAG: hypothetical protein HY231_19760 [Acidobacteria bacterium]|nr:hypothetical protein [Acidobacteriota bacterium]